MNLNDPGHLKLASFLKVARAERVKEERIVTQFREGILCLEGNAVIFVRRVEKCLGDR